MSKVPRGISARRFARALSDDGFIEARTRGSHTVFEHEDGRIVIVASHKASEDFPIGTLKRMIRDARWTEEDLRRLDLVR